MFKLSEGIEKTIVEFRAFPDIFGHVPRQYPIWKPYGQGAQAESVNSMMKRNLGDS